LLAGVVCILAVVSLNCSEARVVTTRTLPSASSSSDAELNARLARVEQELAESEARAARAREEARFFECKTSVERVRAEILAERTGCLRQIADQAACAAREEREKGDTTLIGCILGLGIAYASAGAATPYALGGCAAGRVAGEAAAEACPAPACAATLETAHEPHLRAEGWSEFPQCGGWLGVEVETPLLTLIDGLKVVTPGGLASAGLSEDDFIAYADGKRVKSLDDLATAISARSAAALELRYVRAQKMFAGKIEWPQAVGALRTDRVRLFSIGKQWREIDYLTLLRRGFGSGSGDGSAPSS
jgi:hypothetical protein